MKVSLLIDSLSRQRRDPPHRRTEYSLLYTSYMRSPAWAEKREELFAARGRKCERCGAEHDLEVHHLHYARLGSEELEDLEVLCRACHVRADAERSYAALLRITR